MAKMLAIWKRGFNSPCRTKTTFSQVQTLQNRSGKLPENVFNAQHASGDGVSATGTTYLYAACHRWAEEKRVRA